MREAREEIDALGADVLAVGRQADFQARYLDETEDYGFELLLDPDGALTEAVDMQDFRRRKWLLPRTWWQYLRWSLQARQGRPFLSTIHHRPGVLILDPSGRVVWAHQGEVVGDYPPIGTVLKALRTATGD